MTEIQSKTLPVCFEVTVGVLIGNLVIATVTGESKKHHKRKEAEDTATKTNQTKFHKFHSMRNLWNLF